MDDKDLYKIALDTRNFEISLFWQRSNYFLVLNSALALGFFNLQKPILGELLAALGCMSSILWLSVNLGSKYWQSRWEYEVKLLEDKINSKTDLNIKFFSADRDTIHENVIKSLELNNHKGYAKCIDKWILRKPSVSLMMITLSIAFSCGWILLFVSYLIVLGIIKIPY